ncbi:hypothetical protein PACTADRAFT_4875 [Pachysolen tannophilus NRRL Y-2460]|uniref:Uncharacterized protein n=1 Tax=Pachysolen tannophilus NRRL Y-2460 TaxID=669874 RepID=A0A1E4TQI5_PACTA|nr:hypothetical protein PACTADRAFT_4875 [Pachysolen tannophilus NRRL Y-2460]
MDPFDIHQLQDINTLASENFPGEPSSDPIIYHPSPRPQAQLQSQAGPQFESELQPELQPEFQPENEAEQPVVDPQSEEYDDYDDEIQYLSSGEESEYTIDSDMVKTAQQQWEESLIQVKTLINFVLLPIIGRFLGRRFSKFIWSKVADRIWKGL